MQLVLATENPHKLQEMVLLLGDTWEVVALKSFPNLVLPPETGCTFLANAILKAQFVAKATGFWSLADDSGLAVKALNGQPGVYSARFAGEAKDDAANNAKLLELMRDIPAAKRGAAFVCAIALAGPNSEVQAVEGRCRGEIGWETVGSGGFGYDPLFYIPELNKTFAELTMAEKGQISHRGQAIQKILPLIANVAELDGKI